MSTTPRTDAAWSFAFTASEFSAASAARQMRDKCAEIETELARLRSEVERLKAIGSWAHTCIHHTDDEFKAWVACPCCAIARAERAEAECLEQARLLGMSGEREADLLSELDAIKRGHGELGKYEQLRLKNAELHSIIDRASTQFFHQGTDGEILTKMLTILNESK